MSLLLNKHLFLNAQANRRVLATDEWLRVEGCDKVYAIGDCATINQRKVMVSAPVISPTCIFVPKLPKIAVSSRPLSHCSFIREKYVRHNCGIYFSRHGMAIVR